MDRGHSPLGGIKVLPPEGRHIPGAIAYKNSYFWRKCLAYIIYVYTNIAQNLRAKATFASDRENLGTDRETQQLKFLG